MSKTCPKCGSGSIGDRGLLYYCGNKSTGVHETGKCIKIQRDQLLERIKQLEEAGDGLQKASLVFLLSFVGDDYYADEGTPIRQVDPDASVQWEDPPTAGDHVQLQNAIDKWNQAVAAARAVLEKAKEAKP